MPGYKIKTNMDQQLEAFGRVQCYTFGTRGFDSARGYDHISSGIGKATLAYATPKEHIGLPNREDVEVGVVAYKLAAPSANQNQPSDAFIAPERLDAKIGMKAISGVLKEKGGEIACLLNDPRTA